MNFFLEMFLTVILALFFYFLLSNLVSVDMARNSGSRENDPTSDQAENPDIGVRDGFALKMNAPVLESQRNFRAVDQNVETVEADRVDPLEEVVMGNGKIGGERAELMFRTAEAESTPERVVVEDDMIRGQEEAESEEVRVQSSNAVEESEYEEEKEELLIEEEEDDDWEGIERSELEKAFAVAVNFLEESGKGEVIGAEAKMELYGLHKIATEGSCRVTQPMVVMVSARAKWNAWKKLGNMNQEEAMEQYLTLVSKEIPAYNVGKMPEMVTSVGLNPLS